VFLKRVIKGAFSQRRKTIINSLKGAFPEYTVAEISTALEQCAIDPRQRAETLHMDTFICLAAALKKDGSVSIKQK
jgi:16S rRNA (adenine1518-N6/adenine1519-N6)-dimethyltransferase